MRISEVLSSKFCDIKRKDSLVHVGPSKGRQDRYTLICQSALEELEFYYRDLYKDAPKPTADTLIFMKHQKSNNQLVPMTYEDARILLNRILERAGMTDKGYTLHSFRHGFALELYLSTHDLVLVATVLGHKHLSATEIYVRLSATYKIQECNINNPLDAALKNQRELWQYGL